MTIFIFLHAAHLICALFQMKRSLNKNLGSYVWKQVRGIPASLAGYNPHHDYLKGTEDFGDAHDEKSSWGTQFSDLDFNHVKVESADRKYIKVYGPEDIIGHSCNTIDYLKEDDYDKIRNGGGVGVYILHRESSEGVLLGLFSQIFGISFYLSVILYNIWKRKLMDFAGDSPHEQKYCETLVAGWLRFEIRIFMGWLVSCAIFLAMFNVLKCRSKFKKYEEDLNLETLWNRKNSMDYLHYMSFE